MAYNDFDRSIHAGQVVELYEFLSGATYYRYTSGDQDVTFDSNTYTAVSVLRSTLAVASLHGGSREFEVELPVSLQVVQDHVGIPKDSLSLTVYRYHSSESNYVQQWDGRVAGFHGAPPLLSARCITNVDDPMEVSIPTVHDQRQCAHALYDDRCTVDRTDFDFVTAVNGTPSGRTVVVDSVDSNPDGYYNAGYIVRTSDGARRTIRTQVGTTLTIQSPFRSLDDNDGVTLYAGCDLLATTCRDTFDNVVNFGGCPTTYDRSIFDVGRLIRNPFGRGSS